MNRGVVTHIDRTTNAIAAAIGEAVDLPCNAAQPRSLMTIGDIGLR